MQKYFLILLDVKIIIFKGSFTYINYMVAILLLGILNSTRSQMAEALIKKLSRGSVKVISAGDQISEKIHPFTIQAMAEIGIDISNQQPKKFNAKMVKEVDHIVSMGVDVPKNPNFYPIVWNDVINWDLDNPSGSDFSFFQDIRDKIQIKVKKMFEMFAIPYENE